MRKIFLLFWVIASLALGKGVENHPISDLVYGNTNTGNVSTFYFINKGLTGSSGSQLLVGVGSTTGGTYTGTGYPSLVFDVQAGTDWTIGSLAGTAKGDRFTIAQGGGLGGSQWLQFQNDGDAMLLGQDSATSSVLRGHILQVNAGNGSVPSGQDFDVTSAIDTGTIRLSANSGYDPQSGGISMYGIHHATKPGWLELHANNVLWAWPLADGSAGQFLKTNGSGTLSFASAVGIYNKATKTAGYTLSGSDDVILADASGGLFSLTLPSAVSNPGKAYYLKKIDSTFNTVSILTTSSQTIDGLAATNFTLTEPQSEIGVMSDGSNWVVLNRIGGKFRQVASSTGSYSNTCGSTCLSATATNQSITLTTRGKPLRIYLEPDGTTNAAQITASCTGSAVCSNQMQLQKDGTQIAVFNLANNQDYGIHSFYFEDTSPSVASHTYRIQTVPAVTGGTGNSIATLNWVHMVIEER